MDYCRSIGINGRTIPLTGQYSSFLRWVSRCCRASTLMVSPPALYRSLSDLNSVTVPGAASGWCTTIEEFGNGKLSMSEILAPYVLSSVPREDFVRSDHLTPPVARSEWQKKESLSPSSTPTPGDDLRTSSRTRRPPPDRCFSTDAPRRLERS